MDGDGSLFAKIEAWLSVVRCAKWSSLVDLKRTFPDADYVKPYVIFNVRGNRSAEMWHPAIE